MTKKNKIRLATGAALALLLLLLFCPKRKKQEPLVSGANGGGLPGGPGGPTPGQEPMIPITPPPPAVDYEGDVDDFGDGVVDVVGEKEPIPPPPVVQVSEYEIQGGVGEQVPPPTIGGTVRP